MCIKWTYTCIQPNLFMKGILSEYLNIAKCCIRKQTLQEQVLISYYEYYFSRYDIHVHVYTY